MGAPVPVSWEANKPGGLSAPPASRPDTGPGLPNSITVASFPGWLLGPALDALVERQERLLLWGQLLLEGG
ncbi:MAG: hypothetical protein WD273_03990 [Trueperaceae bacterium]